MNDFQTFGEVELYHLLYLPLFKLFNDNIQLIFYKLFKEEF